MSHELCFASAPAYWLIDPHQYSGHSFRIGGATSAAVAGLNDYEIKLLRRWSSDCYKCYIRSPLSLFLKVPRQIADTGHIISICKSLFTSSLISISSGPLFLGSCIVSQYNNIKLLSKGPTRVCSLHSYICK